jgi:hypothetical protein
MLNPLFLEHATDKMLALLKHTTLRSYSFMEGTWLEGIQHSSLAIGLIDGKFMS